MLFVFEQDWNLFITIGNINGCCFSSCLSRPFSQTKSVLGVKNQWINELCNIRSVFPTIYFKCKSLVPYSYSSCSGVPRYSRTSYLRICLFTSQILVKNANFVVKMDISSDNSIFKVQNDGAYLPRITRETCIPKIATIVMREHLTKKFGVTNLTVGLNLLTAVDDLRTKPLRLKKYYVLALIKVKRSQYLAHFVA